ERSPAAHGPTCRTAAQASVLTPDMQQAHSSRAPVTVLHVVEAIGAGVARHVTDIVQLASGVRHEVAAPAVRVGWHNDNEAGEAISGAGGVVCGVEMRPLPLHPKNARAWLTL